MNRKLIELFLLFAAFSYTVDSVSVTKWFKAPDGSNLFIDKVYKYNWFQAWNECASRNMTLIALDTAEKCTDITSLLKEVFQTSFNFWLGGTDLGEEDSFVWASSGKKIDYTNWSLNNPDNYQAKEHCVHIWEESDFEWNDNDCKVKMGIICEENHCRSPG